MPSGRITVNPIPVSGPEDPQIFMNQLRSHLQELKNALNADELSTILIEDNSRVVQELKLFALMVA